MYKALSKIVNGLVFILLDIDLNISFSSSFRADIIPDFIGYIFVGLGCKMLYDELGNEGLKKASFLAYILAVIEIFTIGIPFMPGFQHSHIVSIIAMLINVVAYTFFNENMDIEGYRKDIGRMASVTLLVFAFLVIFRQFEGNQFYGGALLIVGLSVIITGITWFVSLNRLRKSFEALD